jgi:hydroxymethylbilane synthase
MTAPSKAQSKTIKIGSRKSRLALWQTHHVAALLEKAHEDLDVEIVTMDTLGDKILDKSLPEIGGKGIFTAELEQALMSDAIDLAVHSLKDLPTDLPDGLEYAGSPERATATDSLISTKWSSIDELPEDAIIATGSIRRRAELLARHPTFEFRDLRGNIGTRLEKLDKHGFDAIVMATAALERLEMHDTITCELPADQYVPAVGQGAIGIEIREGRGDVEALLAPILHEETVAAVTAERVVMNRLEGGCSVPLGAHCRPTDEGWRLDAWVGSKDGRRVLHETLTGDDPRAMADEAVATLVDKGARSILGHE